VNRVDLPEPIPLAEASFEQQHMWCGALPQLSFSSMLFGRPFFRLSLVLGTVLDRRHLRDSGE